MMAASGGPHPSPLSSATSSSQHDDDATMAEPARWSMPGALPQFAPSPIAAAASSRLIQVRQHSHQEMLELAAAHNQQQGLPDVFDAVLRGIPERAQLRPNSVEASTYTMGLKGLPPNSRHAKAWRKVLRSTRTAGHQHAPPQQPAGHAANRAGGAGAAVAATEAGGGGAKRQPKPAAATAADRLALWHKLQPANLLTAEQRAFRSALAAFLGRPVNVPLLAVGAPVLDLQQLLKEVTTRGKADWQLIAAYVQRDTSLAALVAAVYECFLQPLEDHMPYGYRPARALDLMLGETQQRAAMGAGVVCYEAVAHSAEQAATSLERLAAAPQHHTAQAASQQQQQSSHAGSGSGSGTAGNLSQRQQQGSTPPPASEQQQQQQAAGSSLAAQHGMQLLRHAALQPELLVEQLLQQGLQEGLHQPSKAACIVWRKQILATRHKTNRSDLELFYSKEAKAAAAAARAGAGPEAKAGAPAAGPAPAGAASGSIRGRGRGRGRSRGRGSGRVQVAAAAEEQQPDDAAIAAISCANVQQLDAARWLLLSRRAALGGPPGCRQPLLRLPGMEAQPKGGGKGKGGGSGRGGGSSRAGGRVTVAAAAPPAPTAAAAAAPAGGRSKRKR